MLALTMCQVVPPPRRNMFSTSHDVFPIGKFRGLWFVRCLDSANFLYRCASCTNRDEQEMRLLQKPTPVQKPAEVSGKRIDKYAGVSSRVVCSAGTRARRPPREAAISQYCGRVLRGPPTHSRPGSQVSGCPRSFPAVPRALLSAPGTLLSVPSTFGARAGDVARRCAVGALASAIGCRMFCQPRGANGCGTGFCCRAHSFAVG